MAEYAAETAVEEYVRVIPVIGSILAGAISATTTYYGCKTLLDAYTSLAEQLAGEVARALQEETEKKEK
jgi:hypothetical protein